MRVRGLRLREAVEPQLNVRPDEGGPLLQRDLGTLVEPIRLARDVKFVAHAPRVPGRASCRISPLTLDAGNLLPAAADVQPE